MALGFSSCSFLTHSVKNPLIFPKKNTNSDLNFMYSIFPAAISTSKNFTHCQCATTQGGEELFLVNSSNTPDVDYLGESTKGDLYLNMGTFVFLKVCIFCNLFSFQLLKIVSLLSFQLYLIIKSFTLFVFEVLDFGL